MQLLISFPGIRLYSSRFSMLIMMWYLSGSNPATGQIFSSTVTGSNNLNQIQTSVPFLTIAPDAVSSSMGDAGVASLPDANSQHWNSAKYAFTETRTGLSATLTPWLRNLVPGILHFYASGFYRINERSGFSSSFRYFDLGNVYLIPASGGPVTSYFHSREFAVDAGYNMKLTEKLAGGILIRYIQSDLTDNRLTASGDETFPGISLATDLGLYYQDDFQAGEKQAQWAFGLNLSNLGSPISYSKNADKIPIPSNLRIGSRLSLEIDESNKLSLMADLNKLLVPTPPVYDTDTATNERIVIRGKAPPRSVPLGMIQSFYDAPGVLRDDGFYSVLTEELHEITLSLGAEYRYKEWLAIRTGYFHEHATKGNRKYFTMGAGFKWGIFGIDVSYLVPVNGQNSPLHHTIRVTLSSNFGVI